MLCAPHDHCGRAGRADRGVDRRRIQRRRAALGLLVSAEVALVRCEHATIAGVTVAVMSVDCGPGARTGLTARVMRDGTTHGVALADLTFSADSALGVAVAAYRRWQGR